MYDWLPQARPTLPKHAWTMNRWAVEGSANDTYAAHPCVNCVNCVS